MKDLASDNIHGQLGESPNKMYKNYIAWFKKTYDSSKKPLAFKTWLVWAQNKGVVMSADGDSSKPIMQTLEVKIREIQLSYVMIGAGLGFGLSHVMKNKNIAWFIAAGAVLGAVVSLLIPKIKVETESSESGSKGGGGGSGSGAGSNVVATPMFVVASAPRKIVRARLTPKVKPTPTTQVNVQAKLKDAPIIQTSTTPSTPPVGANVKLKGNLNKESATAPTP